MTARYLLMALMGLSLQVTAQSFVDAAPELGIEHIYGECGKASGVALTDFNGDGLDDLLLPTCSGLPIRMYKNTGGGFVEYFHPTIMDDQGESKCILAADYDNDGDRDLLVINAGSPNKLYRNDGPNLYTDISAWAGLWNTDYDSYSATFGDIDLDGDLDLYIGNRAPTGLIQPNPLYRNNGDGTFTEVGSEAGVHNGTGATLAVGFADFDNDGWPDLYVANDKLTGNKLYRNEGDGTFANLSASSGTNYEMDAMSVSLADVNHDGFLDLYVTNTPTGNAFFINNQDLTFDEVAEDWGLSVNKGTWGALFVDLESDGDQDLYVPAMGPAEDLSNDCFAADGADWIATPEYFPADDRPGMGAATGDWNQDGRPDLVVTNMGQPAYIFSNELATGNWIEILPLGTLSGTEAVGSWIEVHCGTDVFSRYTTLGSNFASQDSRSVHIGIGEHTSIDHVIVRFPLGTEEVVNAPLVNSELTVVEGGFLSVESPEESPMVTPFSPGVWQINSTQTLHWSLLDLRGRQLQQGTKKAGTASVDLSRLPSGSYVLWMQSPEGHVHSARIWR